LELAKTWLFSRVSSGLFGVVVGGLIVGKELAGKAEAGLEGSSETSKELSTGKEKEPEGGLAGRKAMSGSGPPPATWICTTGWLLGGRNTTPAGPRWLVRGSTHGRQRWIRAKLTAVQSG